MNQSSGEEFEEAQAASNRGLYFIGQELMVPTPPIRRDQRSSSTTEYSSESIVASSTSGCVGCGHQTVVDKVRTLSVTFRAKWMSEEWGVLPFTYHAPLGQTWLAETQTHGECGQDMLARVCTLKGGKLDVSTKTTNYHLGGRESLRPP
jgi:hypothetical protein